MACAKDPAEVVKTIARSIQVSQRGARRVQDIKRSRHSGDNASRN
jgi:hypothetical protein